MNTTCHIRLIIVLLMVFLTGSAQAIQLHSVETEHLRLVYFGRIHGFLVPHIARSFENSFRLHRELFDYTPSEKVTLLLHDFSDYTNAGAAAVPLNTLILSMAPFSHDFETMPLTGHHAVMNHELVHILAMDQAAGRDEVFRKIFAGKVAPTEENPLSLLYAYWTTPRRFAPTWYHEGIAVFLETWMNGGLGRAQGAYDEMVFRTLVRDDEEIYDLLGLESEGTKINFQVGVNSYLYGARFMSYLAYHYEPEKLIRWVARDQGSEAYFAAQFKKVFEMDLDEAWNRWIEWEREFQTANLATIRRHPVTPVRDISDHALGSISRAVLDRAGNRLLAAVNYPGQLAHIAAIDLDDGSLTRICNIKGPALYFVCSLAYDPATGTLFYTTDNNNYRDLQSVNVKTGEQRLLAKDIRVGDLAFNQADGSLWGVRHFNGVSTLVRIAPPYNEWDQVHSYPYTKDIYDLAVSPDGSTLTAALADISGKQLLIKMNIGELENGNAEHQVLQDFENSIPASFQFSDDGRYLFGSSYYSGVSNIYRYDLEKDDIVPISNAETGLFRPLPLSDDEVVVFRYSNQGFTPAIIPNKQVERVAAITFLGNEVVARYPQLKDWRPGSIADVDYEEITRSSGEYHPLREVRPVSIYPIVEGYKNHGAVGMRFNFSSPLRLHQLDMTASYTPNTRLPSDERFHFRFGYHYLDWKVSGWYNGADFYDLFGPTKTSRRGYSLALDWTKTLIYDVPVEASLNVFGAGYGGLDTLPFYQNIESPVEKMASFGATFSYSDMRASLGAVAYEKGLSWEVTSYNTAVHREFYPQVFTTFDFGIPLPVHHSSVWIRSAAGVSKGEPDNPFANFYFGGFGNNWIDYRKEQRYREFYSFPGTDLNEIGGTNFTRVLVEWALPPIRFERAGIPALYLTWIRPSIFGSGLVTNLADEKERRKLANAGIQFDFRLMTLSNMNLTLSVGYAAAWEKGHKPSHEFMASLKVF